MSKRTWWRPLSVPPWRAIAEAVVAYAMAVLLGAAFNGFAAGAGTVVSGVLVALGWIALGFWPAWRTYRVEGRWRIRVPFGIARALLMVIALTVAAVVLTTVVASVASFWPISGVRASSFPAVAVLITVLFALTRIAVLLGWWALDRARRRLRWQLMASHVGVIILTLAALTAMGSVTGIAIVLYTIQPNTVEMANSVHDQLALTGQPVNASEVRRVFRAIDAGQIPLRGQAPLAAFIGGSAVGMPQGMALLWPNGTVVGGAAGSTGILRGRRWSDMSPVTRTRWLTLKRGVLRGEGVSLSIGDNATTLPNGATLAAVPMPVARSRPDILLVATLRRSITALQFFQAAIVIFGATTMVLIVIAGLPLLAISFLFSYLVARGLTRRLEAVSAVATAIAGGNFEQRATVRSSDEIGQLADDLNRMAARLQDLVGELTQARLQAEEDLRLRQELVANVSHELRTPVAVLRAQLESIETRTAVGAGGSDRAVPVPPGTIQALHGETLRLAIMIDDLFALSRASTGTLTLQTEPVDVRAVVDEVTEFMRPLAQRESAVTLSADVPPDLPPVAGDRGRLHQILSNLVRNAIRHTAEGGIVVITAMQEADRVILSVSDTGEGIAPEDLPRVFERFYRADRSRARETGGAGLGLAIVQELVELMGGSVDVESEPGQGSRFTVSLPIATLCT